MSTSILILPTSFITNSSSAEFNEAIDYYKPDSILVKENYGFSEIPHQINQDIDVFKPSDRLPSKMDDAEEVNIYFDFGQHENPPDIETKPPNYIITNRINLEIDDNQLETRVKGIDRYMNNLTPELQQATFISTEIDAGYRRTWGEVFDIAGISPRSSRNGLCKLHQIQLKNNQKISFHDLRQKRLGLTAIEDVGEKRSKRLKDDGIETKQSLADTETSWIANVADVSLELADKISKRAEAIVDGEVVRLTQDTPPENNCIFIDIETDGLNPSAVWLIGVYDSKTDNYMSFLEKDTSKPIRPIETFIQWYKSNRPGKPVVAWNGYQFGFDVMKRLTKKHYPDMYSELDSMYLFDILWWCRDKNNAVLPGVTNKLEDVAEAIGYSGCSHGLSEKEVADIYTSYRDRDLEAPDWDALEKYCKDDVYALKYIYESILDADKPSKDQGKLRRYG